MAMVLITMVLTSLFALDSTVFGYNLPETIRVGLEYKYKEVDSVPISNKKIKIGIQNDEKYCVEAEISATDGFSVAMPLGKMVDVNKFYSNYDDAIDASEEIKNKNGYDAVPAYVGKKLWGVYISGLDDSKAKCVINDIKDSIIASTANVTVLKDGSRVIMVFNQINPQITHDESDAVVTLGDRSYRGVIEFGRYKGNKITAVNVVSVDEYLYGVVPSEMPSGWEKEALKAQAVAARSYVATSMGRYADSGYDVCDGTKSQVYIGYGQEKASTNMAVDETSGVLAYYNGQPINAVFCSSSGGSTEDAGNVWTYDIAYLKAVPEMNENGVLEWTRTYTSDEIKTILAGKGINIGTIKDIKVTSIGAYGRVQAVTITGSNGTKVLTKEETRTIFSGTSEGSLKSRMYTINGQSGENITGDKTTCTTVSVQNNTSLSEINLENSYILGSNKNSVMGEKASAKYAISVNNKVSEIQPNITAEPITNNKITSSGDTSEGTFVFKGKGSGHGVGMSQYGAKGMAEIGYTYKEILKYYYTGITVE